MDCTNVSGALFSRRSAKNGVVTARQDLDAAKHYTLERKALKTLHQGVDGSVFGPRRRERIAFLAKFVEAGLGGRKARLGRGKTRHFREKSVQMDGTNACLDRTGVSGSRFLQKTAKHGLGAVKQSRGPANHCILAKKV